MIISSNHVELVPSLRTTYDADLYGSMKIRVDENRCFSRPIIKFKYFNKTIYRQITPANELSNLFAYTKFCDGVGEYLFEIGDKYHHFVDYTLRRSYKTEDLLHHGKNIECLLNIHNDTDHCDELPSIRFIDTYTKLDQDLTRHLEFSEVDPRIYNNSELKSYFSVLDAGTAIAFLQDNKEAIYHYHMKMTELAREDDSYDASTVFESVAGAVAGTVSGLITGIGKGIKGFFSSLFDNVFFQAFLFVGAIGGALQLLELIFKLFRATTTGFHRRKLSKVVVPEMRGVKPAARF
jgi:hypothetical protein